MVSCVRKGTQEGVREKCNVRWFLFETHCVMCVCYRIETLRTVLRMEHRDTQLRCFPRALVTELDQVQTTVGYLVFLVCFVPVYSFYFRVQCPQHNLINYHVYYSQYLVLCVQQLVFCIVELPKPFMLRPQLLPVIICFQSVARPVHRLLRVRCQKQEDFGMYASGRPALESLKRERRMEPG